MDSAESPVAVTTAARACGSPPGARPVVQRTCPGPSHSVNEQGTAPSLAATKSAAVEKSKPAMVTLVGTRAGPAGGVTDVTVGPATYV